MPAVHCTWGSLNSECLTEFDVSLLLFYIICHHFATFFAFVFFVKTLSIVQKAFEMNGWTRCKKGIDSRKLTWNPKHPKNGDLEDDVPFPLGWCLGSMLIFSGVIMNVLHEWHEWRIWIRLLKMGLQVHMLLDIERARIFSVVDRRHGTHQKIP